MLDARRMEVFTAQYDQNLNPMKDVEAVIVDENTFADLLENHKTIFCGNGAGKCQPLFEKHPNASFNLTPVSARNMAGIALKKLIANQIEDLAYFTPLYGKDYVAAKPHVKGLH